jgi:hypothetical protein
MHALQEEEEVKGIGSGLYYFYKKRRLVLKNQDCIFFLLPTERHDALRCLCTL